MRHQFIIARMKENGGCRVWDWKKPHVAAMLVKMGLEEETMNEKTGTRRRRQKAARRQASPHQNGGGHAVMGDWSNGLGLYHGHAHHVAAGAAARAQGQQPFDAMMGGGGDDHFGGPPHLTPKQEEDLINDVFRDVKMERSLSPDDSMDGLSYGTGNGNGTGGARRPSTGASSREHLNHQGSARVARQACDQLLQHPPSQIPEHAYGAQ